MTKNELEKVIALKFPENTSSLSKPYGVFVNAFFGDPSLKSDLRKITYFSSEKLQKLYCLLEQFVDQVVDNFSVELEKLMKEGEL